MNNLNAGGTGGGVGRFFLGLAMMVVGGYLFLDAIHIVNRFGFRTSLYMFNGIHLRSGMVLVPFVIGVGLIFYNSKWIWGWVIAVGAIAAFSFGVITSIQFRMKPMTAFDIIMILVLTVGGVGLFLSSLRDYSRAEAGRPSTPSAPDPNP